MKTIISFAMVLAILVLGRGTRAADGLTQTLQHGLYEEEANQNLDAAIKAYQSVVTQSEEQRKVVATALFRLGECYRKLGKTNEATAQYQRIIRDFSEQEQLVKLSRENVAKVGGSAASSANPGQPKTNPEAEELAWIRAMVKDSPDLVNSRAAGATPLHTAAESGFLSVAEFLLANGANVNAENDRHETPLHRAAFAGHKSMVELLLQHGAEVNRPNGLGGTALYYAALNGYKGIVEVLIAHKADVNTVTSDDHNQPLHAAAEDGYAAVAGVLLDHGAELERQSSGRRGTAGTPLHLAAARGQVQAVKVLLEHKADVNLFNAAGDQPLHIAARKGFAPVCELLIDHGASLSSLSKGYRRTPFHEAAMNGYGEVVELFLKRKADLNSKDGNGSTSLNAAATAGRADVVKLLLQAGADPNAQNNNGESPLFGLSNTEVMGLLLKHKADPDLKSRSGATPVSYLVHQNLASNQSRNEDAIELLLENRANPNVANQDGTPLLYSAVNAGKLSLIELLLNHGADPNVLVNGSTPLSLAQKAVVESQSSAESRIHWQRIEKLLLDHGANENLQRLSTISYRRPGWSSATTVFTRGTNDFNQYTLFELVANLWGAQSAQPVLPFPDFAHITIDRLDSGTSKSTELHVNIDDSGDCSKDLLLQWGDRIIIPELDHSLNESWSLPGPERDFLMQCLTRHVQIIVKQETNTIRLVPGFPQVTFPPAPALGAKRKERLPSPFQSKNEEEKTLSSFALKTVVYGANVLRASSDTTRVQVRRFDRSAKRPREWTFDLGSRAGNFQIPVRVPGVPGPAGQIISMSGSEPDLWLRDGDVIEIPEKR